VAVPPTRDSETSDIVDVRQQHQTHSTQHTAHHSHQKAQENQKMDNNFKPVPNGAASLPIFACYLPSINTNQSQRVLFAQICFEFD